MVVEYRVSPKIDDQALSELHHRAFGSDSTAVVPWTARLTRYSLCWVTAEDESGLIGFVNVVGDGGVHAFVIDTTVLPARQGEGIGRRLIEVAVATARSLGCEWLHVDFEPDLAAFYLGTCGFRSTKAGLIRLAS
ncbi:GNAT family N-acetyltransferase [Microbacterium sp. C5A9]|uniref:GNAT family N-acetyltransferase n=1 Tax=Microbacterium sp. C5A9 TaxID=2736663 RepID=UPI001F525D4D|nr:GNAT family N-acetyltransferase [Microbacterium sp. C5A9]MCI1020264.1 GNAT family N-acetyltransferase [Microbacterium sp. C5A9]